MDLLRKEGSVSGVASAFGIVMAPSLVHPLACSMWQVLAPAEKARQIDLPGRFEVQLHGQRRPQGFGQWPSDRMAGAPALGKDEHAFIGRFCCWYGMSVHGCESPPLTSFIGTAQSCANQ